MVTSTYGILNYFEVLAYLMIGYCPLQADAELPENQKPPNYSGGTDAKPDQPIAYTGGKDAKPGGEV